jgi:hypothetical protein
VVVERFGYVRASKQAGSLRAWGWFIKLEVGGVRRNVTEITLYCSDQLQESGVAGGAASDDAGKDAATQVSDTSLVYRK